VVRHTPDLSGRVAVVTGANRGIGKATVEGLARTGARVVLVTRRVEDGEAAAHDIAAATGNPALEGCAADLAVQAQVREAARVIGSRHAAVHVLVNNAAVASKRRTLSPDGIEMTVAVNHLAYFTLTLSLLDRIVAAAPSRIVNVSSGAHLRERLDFDDLENAEAYGGVQAYGRSKLMNVLFTFELARRLEGTGVTVNALHPGVIGTRLLVTYFPRFLQPIVSRVTGTPDEGADTILHLATSPDIAGVTGSYFKNRAPSPVNPMAKDRTVAERLWEWSARRVGLPADVPPRKAVV
jgi:NAD(P)-dependent dehydrogenase (short-subunit alcohol dehydrogenase family)